MKFSKVLSFGSLILFSVIGLCAIVKNLFFSFHSPSLPNLASEQHQEEDRIKEFFNVNDNKFPVVETITYTSNVPWLKGRPAWIGDYARYYATSRHFIARSLNGKPDYFTQTVYPGSKFNVFKKDCNFHFYLLVDRSRSKMGFYYIDLDTNQRVLIKTYEIGTSKNSGPLGKYLLGNTIAVYKPGIMDFVQGEKKEMIAIFGTRWIPLGQEVENCTVPAKGFGIHGAPWFFNEALGKWVEDRQKIHGCDNGSICLGFEDLEEIFSIVVTKPTVIDIVQDSTEAILPGIEVNIPSR